MATITTYLLVSGVEDTEALSSHELFDAYAFEERETVAPDDDNHVPSVTFALEQPLEEKEEMADSIRRFSADVSEATVVLCTVEERFGQIELLQMTVFQNGKRGGEVEHGHVFNVGAG